MDENAMNQEMFQWKQDRLEKGKFPCKCGHFENSHVKGLCLVCHGEENHLAVSHGEGFSYDSCFHPYSQMDNLTVVEWIAAHKETL